MGLKLEKGLLHQQRAIECINAVFEDVLITKSSMSYANPTIPIYSDKLRENINKLIKVLPAAYRKNAEIDDYINIDIKMETGTGKTYVYTQTIYELNKNYGMNKFIILVPSIAIKLGTINFIRSEDTRKHFYDQYGKEIDLFVLDASKGNKKSKENFPSSIREFVATSRLLTNRISVLVVNMQLFKDNSMLTKDYSGVVEGFYNPTAALNATKPIIIMDEPHRFSKDNKTFEYIRNKIKPQCIIRFGATFPDVKNGKLITKDYHNLIYNLGSCDAFNQNLVKGVKVKYLESSNGKNIKIKLLETESKKKARFQVISENNKKTYELERGDSLKILDESFENIFIDGIGKDVFLSNGQILNYGSEIFADVYSTSYQEAMLKDALNAHFEIEKQNFKRDYKIKSIALFFIDDIDSYRENKDNPKPTYLRDIFEKLLKNKIKDELNSIDLNNKNEILYKEYLEESLHHISKTHGGYFSRDNVDSDENIAKEIEQILIKKEETISIYRKDGQFNTFRFIFSKWTLKEGWDNPNVFTIAKLRSSGSEVSKIQEVGRGLRLPVNEKMSRISDEQFYLNYIIDFTEKDFANKLIKEINGEFTENVKISDEQLMNLADKLGMSADDLFVQMLSEKYIDRNRNIMTENREELFAKYPELSAGLQTGKVILMNTQRDLKTKVKPEKFAELKNLWRVLNQKYMLMYEPIKDEELEEGLLKILNSRIKGTSEFVSVGTTVGFGDYGAYIVHEPVVVYGAVEELPYNQFLNKIYQSTNIPIRIIHKSLCKYHKTNPLDDTFFNLNTMINFINAINQWKINTLYGKFTYAKSKITTNKTALTDETGNMIDLVPQANLGMFKSEDKPSDKYLYELCMYDSELEKKNITTTIEDVVVFGKIPSSSIRIPIMNGATYSPDFMYVIKKRDGSKELNLVIETKDYKNENEVPSDQQFKINCARRFFDKLKEDGVEVKFRTQLKNDQIITIIKELT